MYLVSEPGKKNPNARYAMVSMSVTEKEKDRIQKEAGKAGLSVSNYLRSIVFKGGNDGNNIR